MKQIWLTAIAVLGLNSASASADPLGDFTALIDDYEAHIAQFNLGARAREGDLEAAASWPDASFEAAVRWDEAMQGFDQRIDAIDPADLPQDQQANYAVLAYTLDSAVQIPRTTTAMIPFTNDSGFHTAPDFAALTTRVRTVEEAEAWIAKLEALPAYLDQHKAWLDRAIETGYTQPSAILPGIADQIEAQIVPVEQSQLLVPIRNLPEALDASERARLEAEAHAAIDTAVLPALEGLHTYFTQIYMPAARDSLGARSMPGGDAFYRALVRQHTTLDLTPDEVHQRGQAEVARIRAEMDLVIAETGFEGSFAEFLEFLRTDPQFYAESERELMMVASYLSKKADDAMPRFFNHLPRLSYGVRPVPAAIAPNYTTGRYWPGNAETGQAGGYMVNTYRLDQRPLYEMPALTVHEAVPGHHHQIAIAQELENVPDFRRSAYITAFGEGWGLYTEYLGVDMGMYETPYEHFGRLTYEMWRACRLVADTGIHWYGWSREQAEACFLENSALAPLNITNEVSRYISWPGQALAYKTGELLIRELRAEGEARYGAEFDLSGFHDHLLNEGGVPLGYLETKMRVWLEEQDAPSEL